ncbi:kelch 40a [Paramuricea clavata]|uniref:Kelch 40a n=1 Tax=Paramuricea clavata TaxID=317549 RepID=A0A6S7JYR0_PARCT|nr:kelch 40a [Paramuricea clavata]
MCQHPLTDESLTKPPRILTDFLQSLMIGCDHENRGCPEVVKLEFLERHVNSCGYSPTRCTNAGCAEAMNRHEKERHEREQCQFRKIACDECGEQVIWKSSRVHPCFMRKHMDNLERRLNIVQNNVREVNDEVKQVKLTQNEMEYLAKEAIERCDLFTGRQKIFVCGGRNENRLNSVESYSWPENSWTLEPAMKQVEWEEPPVKLPLKCDSHKMVCHENSAILTGGLTAGDYVSDGIYEISLDPPHNSKLLTQMPEPRCFHGCEIVDNQVMVAGGQTSNCHRDAKNTVYAYDIKNNECKTLPPLPFAISDMATVSYKGHVILIGGVNEKAQTLNSVVMYDVKTGDIKMLPCLNHKRAGSAAVITGNVIIVVGGYDYGTERFLNAVEYLDLSTNVW